MGTICFSACLFQLPSIHEWVYRHIILADPKMNPLRFSSYTCCTLTFGTMIRPRTSKGGPCRKRNAIRPAVIDCVREIPRHRAAGLFEKSDRKGYGMPALLAVERLDAHHSAGLKGKFSLALPAPQDDNFQIARESQRMHTVDM